MLNPAIRITKSQLKILFLLFFAFLIFNFNSCFLFKDEGYAIKTTAFFITLEDGTKLDCTKFYPEAAPPPGGWSALIYCHGFGHSKLEDSKNAEAFAKKGYYTLVYSMRGQGLSTGLSNLISITEANDFTKVIEYVKKEPFINPERVGAIGGSQGGTVPFMAVCNGLDLRCIVSNMSTPELSTTWIENNSIKMTLLWSLSYDNTIVRYDPTVARMRDWILEDTPEKWDSLIFYLPQGRDFINKVSKSKTPIFVSTVWQDKFFNSYGMLKTIDLLNVPYRMYFGTLDAHGADPYKPQITYNDTISAQWIEYWLGNIQNGCLDSSKFVCVSSTYPREAGEKQVMWNWQPFYSNTWPPDGVEKVKFYFDTGNKLSNTPVDSNTIILHNEIKDTSLNMLEAVNREFTGDIFNSKFTKSELIFETAPLKQPCRLAGTPFVKLFYESDTVIAQFNFQVWEVKPSGEANIVTRANYTDRSTEPNVIREVLFNGISSSHVFGQNSRIRIIITNLDNITDDPFLRTNPHVLPSMVNAKNIIYNSKTKPTYIELPLINYVRN
ncbi:MAG: alpha/beta fold hydrolase [Ignavibacteria bacterium]|nr:alpha/beta fold hydrolase [Bacteroidota bacterium]MBL7127882.1 alpha/beta fold hydrolase [Ignavibacteria bacterium]